MSSFPMVEVDENRKYWLVRTASGELYESFYHDNYIAIGWSLVPVTIDTDEEALSSDLIRKHYPEQQKPGLVLTQLKRFMLEMQVGDIVLIPSKYSQYVSFGIIRGDAFLHRFEDEWEGTELEERRRSVEWIRTVKRDKLDPALYKLFYSQHTITDATKDYGDIIDRTLHSFYVKGDSAHLIIDVKQTKQIAAIDMIDLVSNTLDLVPVLNEAVESNYMREDVTLKIAVQSPGIVEFIGASTLILGLGLILVFTVGGKFKGDFTQDEKSTKATVEASSEGLIEKILQVVKHKDEMQLKRDKMQKNLEKLDAKLPKELEEIKK